MKLSQREMRLALITGIVVLFGGTFFLVMPTLDRLKAISVDEATKEAEIQEYKDLVSKKSSYEAQLTDLSKELDNLGNKKVDIYWLSIMDKLAVKRGVKIGKHQVGKEEQNGDVYELPIKGIECEGDLQAWVHFLFDLQSEGAMLDIRYLYVKPNSKGLLKVNFTLHCAYTRNK